MAYPDNHSYSVAYNHFTTTPQHPPVQAAYPSNNFHPHPVVQRTSQISSWSKYRKFRGPAVFIVVFLLATGGYYLYRHFSKKGNDNSASTNDAAAVTASNKIRLINMVDELSVEAGRVEVRSDSGYWVTVCGDSWTENNAKVVCRMLNPQCFNISGSKARKNAFMGEGNGDSIWVDTISCQGNEASLDQCDIKKETNKKCSHSQDVAIICFCDSKAVNGAVKLMNGIDWENKVYGTVRIGYYGAWGGICDEGIDDVDAQAICKSANNQCTSFNNYAKSLDGARYGKEGSFFWLSGLRCSRGSTISECTLETGGQCTTSQATSVYCYCNLGFEDCNYSHLTAGCKDAECQNCVCSMDAYCCRTAWDELCVSQAKSGSCSQCPSSNSSGSWTASTWTAGQTVCGRDVMSGVISQYPQTRKKREADAILGRPEPVPEEKTNLPIQRVIGGRSTAKLGWPWLVSVRKYKQHACGGTLIKASPNAGRTDIVITAKHCVVDSISQTSVMAGEYDIRLIENTERQRHVFDVILHPSYDLAIIVLDSGVSYHDTLDPVCLPNNNSTFDPSVGHKCVVAGWGATQISKTDDNKASGYPNVPQEAAIPIMSDSDCRTQFNSFDIGDKVDTDYEICAAYPQGGIDSCFGDSGGPLSCQLEAGGRWYLTGVVSRGVSCAKASSPGIYTRVRKFCDWIKRVICEHSRVDGHNAKQYCDRTAPCV